MKNKDGISENGKDGKKSTLAEKSGINEKHSSTEITTQDRNITGTETNLIEKMKSLSEHVSKVSVKDRAELPLSPNSNKENIPYQGKKGRSADLTKLQAQSDSGTQKQLENLSLENLAKQHQPDVTLTAGFSLAEIARMHECKTLPLQSKATLGVKKEKQVAKQTLSLTELANGKEVHGDNLSCLSLGNSAEVQKSLKDSVSAQSMKNKAANQAKTSAVTLADLARKDEKLTEKYPKASLAELAMKHQTVRPSAMCGSKNENKEIAENTKPSLAELIAKHESKAQITKPSVGHDSQKEAIAETAMKSSVSSQVKPSLQDLSIGNKTNQKLSLSEQAKTHEEQAERNAERKDILLDAVAEHKPSLTDLANKFQQSKKSGFSLSDLAVKQYVEGNKSSKTNVSLAELAKIKDRKSHSKVSDETKGDTDKSLIGSLRKMTVLDKEMCRGDELDVKNDEKCKDVAVKDAIDDARRELHIQNLDCLIQVQASKFATHASKFGKTLCLKVRVKRGDKDSVILRRYKTERFSYKAQMKGRENNSPVRMRKLIPYDFSEPSPDDIVKQRQKAAFSRTGERKISN